MIERLFLSPGHNFFGRHGLGAEDHPPVEVPEVECVAGRGLRGDRFFDFKPDYKGQITFFSLEVFDELRRATGRTGLSPGIVRRNAFTRGVDLDAWIGREFEIQGVRFAGTGECAPCYWMDQAAGHGAEAFLQGKGGLRARILNDGILRVRQGNPAS